MNETYEYVPRKEYSPVVREVNEIIQKANSYLRNHTGLSITPMLIGSGKRHLITRVVGGNRGFDLDYNLFIPELGGGERYIPKAVHDRILDAFRYAVEGTRWSAPEESTSVLTIKVKDKKHSKILCGCDLAIAWRDGGCLKYLRFDKQSNSVEFQKRGHSDNTEDYLCEIYSFYGHQRGWDLVRKKYLQVKNSNKDPNKKSFSLYREAVAHVCNEMRS